MSTGPAIPHSALLRVGVTEPPESPRTLVRSYRTVSPLPVRHRRTGARHRRSALCCPEPTGHPVLAHASTLPCGVPTFLDIDEWEITGAAATQPAHRRRQGTCPIASAAMVRLDEVAAMALELPEVTEGARHGKLE